MLCRQDLLESSGQVGNKLTGTLAAGARGTRWLGVSASVTSRPSDSAGLLCVLCPRAQRGGKWCVTGSLVPHKVTAVNRETWSRSSQCRKQPALWVELR